MRREAIDDDHELQSRITVDDRPTFVIRRDTVIRLLREAGYTPETQEDDQ